MLTAVERAELVLESFLLFVDPYHKQIYQLPTTSEEKAVSVRGVAMPTDAQFPVSVVVSADEGRVYWVDSSISAPAPPRRRRRIVRSHFTDDTHTVIADLPQGNTGKQTALN